MLSGSNLQERYTTSSTEKDETYGEYPFILFKHLFITKNNISSFFKQITQINLKANLSQEERNLAEYFETLIRNKLAIVSVILFFLN